MKIAENIPALVGSTPLVYLEKISKGCAATVVAKLEMYNPCGSVKDRVAKNMIETAEADGSLCPGTTIIEPTSGNTGIGLACMCAAKGYPLILTMPESMSPERRKLLAGFGARLVLTPASLGMQGAIAQAQKIQEDTPDSWMPQQFQNPANPAIHSCSTAHEIWTDTDGNVDIFVAGVGTGGTLTGVSRTLKEKKPELISIAIEPADSPVISGGKAAAHGIQGIGAGFIPDNLDVRLLDEVVQIETAHAISMAQKLRTQEGLLCGISSGACVHGALHIARRKEHAGKLLVCLLPDTGERYLSTSLFQETATT